MIHEFPPGSMPIASTWDDDVLRFWFDEVGPTRWFVKDPALDEKIRRRFQALHGELMHGHASITTPRARLAAIIVLDQFSRNMFRGTPQAFAADARARALMRQALAGGEDTGLRKEERLFLYLPLEHSEDRADQAESVQRMAALDDAQLLDYARAHQALVDRFGRFPHRNAALGRTSTPEEEAFLRENPQGF